MSSTTRAVVQPTVRRPGSDDVIGSPCSPWVQRKRHVTADEDTCTDYDKENDDYCYMPSTTPKMRKTAEGRRTAGCIPVQPSSHVSSTTKDVKGKTGGSGLSLVGCFSFRSKKAAAVVKKSKSKATGDKSPAAMPHSANGATSTGVGGTGGGPAAGGTMRSGVPPRKPPRTIGASFEQRQYASIHSAAKIAMDDYVSVVYTRRPFRPPQHIYQNVDEVRHLMGFGYAPPPLARDEDSASLSPQQYSVSLNDDPAVAQNDRLRDFDDEEGNEDGEDYRKEGWCNAAHQYHPVGSAMTLRKPSLRAAACSHQARGFLDSGVLASPRPAPNMSYISQASSLCPPDQMSTASLRHSGQGRPLLHSTFNYPLHSTVVTEEEQAEDDQTEDTVIDVQSPPGAYDSLQACPFQRRGAQRWPARGASRGGSTNTYGTIERRPATLGGSGRGVMTSHHQRQQQQQQQQPVQYECVYVECEDSRRYNTRSGSHIRQVMDGDACVVSSTTTSGSSIASNTNNSRQMSRQSSARSTISNSSALPPAGGLQRKASFRNEVVGTCQQTLQRRPSFRSDCSSTTSGSDLRQVQRKVSSNQQQQQQQHTLQRKTSFHEQSSAQQVQRKPSSFRGSSAAAETAQQRQAKPAATAVQRQPSFGDPFGIRSVLQRQESLLTEINRCLAPRLQRKPQPKSPNASFASDSTFASVTRIDTALLPKMCQGLGDANDDSTLLDEDALEDDDVHDKKIPNNNMKFTEVRKNASKPVAKPSIAQQEELEETGEDYETCADDFSRRLTLMAKRCPAAAGSTGNRFRIRPQSIISECSTCYNGDEQLNSNQNLHLLAEENSQDLSCSTSSIQVDDSAEEAVQLENRRNRADDKASTADDSSEMWQCRRLNVQKKIEQFQHEYAQTIADY